ncbi:hypothetical protein N9E48_03700 [Paracoccaceae bacterium]|jgi:hypothetical protein|nr:hypothetical protein [Paracoccaceae bacterium]
MVLVLRLLAVILVLSIIFFAARKMTAQDKTEKEKIISFPSFLGTVFATLIAIVGFVFVAEIITRM